MIGCNDVLRFELLKNFGKFKQWFAVVIANCHIINKGMLSSRYLSVFYTRLIRLDNY